MTTTVLTRGNQSAVWVAPEILRRHYCFFSRNNHLVRAYSLNCKRGAGKR